MLTKAQIKTKISTLADEIETDAIEEDGFDVESVVSYLRLAVEEIDG